MNAQTYRVNRPDVIDEQFDDEYVIVNLRTGTYYSLNRTAALVWDDIGKNLSHSAILAELELYYQTDSARLAADLDELLTEMVAEQLILLQPQSPTADSETPRPELTSLSPGEYLAPRLEKFTDMQALLLLDPIHQVDESGWPATRLDAR